MNLTLSAELSNKDIKNICIVRLATTEWSDNRGVYAKKSITFLRRKCRGFNIFEEEINAVGAEAINSIINLNECVDGVYKVMTCNESRDWESGHIDGYELKLVPFSDSAK